MSRPTHIESREKVIFSVDFSYISDRISDNSIGKLLKRNNKIERKTMGDLGNQPSTYKKAGTVDTVSSLDINHLPELLTVKEVAAILRVSPITVKRWGKVGKMPAIRINQRGDRRYKKSNVLFYLGIQPTGIDE